MERCKTCKSWIYDETRPHKCPPMWLCRFADEDEDFDYEVYACDAQDAAEKFVDEEDEDYSVVDYGGVNVDIKDSESGEIKSFYVEAEASVSYTASERKEE